MAPISSRACFLLCHLLLQFSPSVGAVLCSLLGFHCLRVGALLACGVYGASSLWGLLSRLPLVVGPLSPVLVGPSPALAVGVVWSHVCDPSCCYCVLGSCGVSVALFCRLGLLRALPCRVFACGFPWFRGPSSWCFLGLFTMVLSSRFRWLRMARGGCCLRFVQGPLPQAGAVFLTWVNVKILTLIDFTSFCFFFPGFFLGCFSLFVFEMCRKLVFIPLSSKVTIIQQGYQGRPMVAQVR